MVFKVLLITPVKSRLKKEMFELKQRGLDIIGVSDFASACKYLEEDGSIHIVLTELSVPKTSRSKTDKITGTEMFKEILKKRYEINIFLFSEDDDSRKFLTGGYLNGYFSKSDEDYDEIYRRIISEINSKKRAPFFDKLIEYSQKAEDSYHTPGHSSGYSLKHSKWVKDFYDFYGPNIFRTDISVSVPVLDSLLDPKGVIKESQELSARAFNARYTFFCSNGTSTSNKILLQTLLKPGDAIILDRNSHQSVHYGIILAGAEPVYLMPAINQKYGIFGLVPKKTIIETMDNALKENKRLKVLFLTNCSYDGLRYDIEDIVKEAHKRDIKVIVDEAWFGYSRFHPEFYPCAMEAGADYSTQSVHKTMSAFSQASMIHINDPDFREHRNFFMENYIMHTSTSPQYPMIASMDIARKQMVMEGYSLLSKALKLSEDIRKSIKSLKKFRVLELDDLITKELLNDNIKLDPLKLTIDVADSGLTAKEVEHLLLSKHNIQVEKTTFNTITVLISIGMTRSKLNRLLLALDNIEKTCSGMKKGLSQAISLSLSPIIFRPRFAFYCDGESLHFSDCENKIATSMVVPYPPGVPILIPGQLITREIINDIQSYMNIKTQINGFFDNKLKVMTSDEVELLSEQGYKIIEKS